MKVFPSSPPLFFGEGGRESVNMFMMKQYSFFIFLFSGAGRCQSRALQKAQRTKKTQDGKRGICGLCRSPVLMFFDFLRGINSKCRVGLEFFLAVLCLCTRLTDRSGEVRKCESSCCHVRQGEWQHCLSATPSADGGVLLYNKWIIGKQITEIENFLDKKHNLA